MSVAAAPLVQLAPRCHSHLAHRPQHSNSNNPPAPASTTSAVPAAAAPTAANNNNNNNNTASTSSSDGCNNNNNNNNPARARKQPPPSSSSSSLSSAPSLSAAQSSAKKNLIRQFFNSRPSRPAVAGSMSSNASLYAPEHERKVPPNPLGSAAAAAAAAAAASDDSDSARCPTPPAPPSPPSPALPAFTLSVKEATPTASSPLAQAAASAESANADNSCLLTMQHQQQQQQQQQQARNDHISPPRGPQPPRATLLKSKPPPSSPVQRILNRYPLNSAFLEKYFITAELGSGGFGHVLAATCRADAQEVAVKLILKKRIPVHAWARDPELGVMPMEVYLVKRCSHPNIVGFKDFYECERFAYLIMEMHGTQWKVGEHPHTESESSNTTTAAAATNAAVHQPPPPPRARINSHPPHGIDVFSTTSSNSSTAGTAAGSSSSPQTLAAPPPLLRANSFPAVLTRQASMDLFEHIEAHSHLPEQHARHIFSQIASAVAYLHSLNIVHRDLKDENIVIDASLTVKLIDFGSAAFENASSNKKASFDRFQGTLHYASPEILEGRRYKGKPSDIWALGVLLYTMLFGECPFKNSDEACGGDYKRPRVSVSAECLALVNWMLEKAPDARPSALQVLEHPWIGNVRGTAD
ncbi:hypothetical protein HDU86_000078 [Geranomyces michiganensis]|nr:hypothetical protein HDU86_000078 [Geranomyces michiganensis]